MNSPEPHPARKRLSKMQTARIMKNLGTTDESKLKGLEKYLEKFDFEYGSLSDEAKRELELIRKHLRYASDIDSIEKDGCE